MIAPAGPGTCDGRGGGVITGCTDAARGGGVGGADRACDRGGGTGCGERGLALLGRGGGLLPSGDLLLHALLLGLEIGSLGWGEVWVLERAVDLGKPACGIGGGRDGAGA